MTTDSSGVRCACGTLAVNVTARGVLSHVPLCYPCMTHDERSRWRAWRLVVGLDVPADPAFVLGTSIARRGGQSVYADLDGVLEGGE